MEKYIFIILISVSALIIGGALVMFFEFREQMIECEKNDGILVQTGNGKICFNRDVIK